MTLLARSSANALAPFPPLDQGIEEYVCWSRMQAEAGQGLEAIVDRKEVERQAGCGLFFWGVGNPPALIAKALARANIPVRAVFSIMRSRPKSIDVAPTRTFGWRRYIDARGVVQSLPAHILVTSRADSPSGPKRSHYALMCRSDEPLALLRGQRFDPDAYRNAGGTGARVGASQVTAMLRRVGEESSETHYEENLTAWLTGGYWVRLVDPVALGEVSLDLVSKLAEVDVKDWSRNVQRILGTDQVETGHYENGTLF